MENQAFFACSEKINLLSVGEVSFETVQMDIFFR